MPSVARVPAGKRNKRGTRVNISAAWRKQGDASNSRSLAGEEASRARFAGSIIRDASAPEKNGIVGCAKRRKKVRFPPSHFPSRSKCQPTRKLRGSPRVCSPTGGPL
ncbi:hypothetical protein MRX96_004485 [Rhipicephalus microplus]